MIAGFQKTSLVDFPKKIVTTIFISGCNFRCPYCHNKDLIDFDNSDSSNIINEILKHLESKKNFLDGVCITGGEPTFFTGLKDFIKNIKDLNLLVKLDTNGTNPKILKELLDENLLDYVAMDIKGPFETYNKYIITKVDINKIKESVELIKNSTIDYEFRTTVLPKLHTKDDILKTVEQLGYSKRYSIQQFRNGKTLDKSYETEKSFLKSELEKIKKEIENKKIVKECILRAN